MAVAAAQSKMERILHVGKAIVKKVWHFNPEQIESYSRLSVEQEPISPFPDVSRRNLQMYLAGTSIWIYLTLMNLSARYVLY